MRHRTQSSFRDLDRIVRQAGLKLQAHAQEPEFRPLQALEGETEEQMYERAMRDVARARWRHTPAGSSPPPHFPARAGDLEDQGVMKDALEEDTSPRIPDHPEYIEGCVGVTGRLFLPHLRNGTYSVQGQLDLHGLSRSEARSIVEEFIQRMSRFRSCCVKIIHGRGINSPNEKAVLKTSLQRWLTTRRMSRHVVAYASAPAREGGVGAVCVLLRHTRATTKTS
jgi:DNA-nicking Smr family endonuclease